jgi:hypothetical protein
MAVIGKRADRKPRQYSLRTDFSFTAEKAEVYVTVLAYRYASEVQLIHIDAGHT